jgi:hypothetical protein
MARRGRPRLYPMPAPGLDRHVVGATHGRSNPSKRVGRPRSAPRPVSIYSKPAPVEVCYIVTCLCKLRLSYEAMARHRAYRIRVPKKHVRNEGRVVAIGTLYNCTSMGRWDVCV